MIRSMTAYANDEATTPQGWLACELRAVNHRFLETGVRLPDELRTLEPQLRERIGERLSRGKVDATFRYRQPAAAADLLLDERTASQLAGIADALKTRFPQLATDFAALLDWPGLLVKPELDQAGLVQAALALLERTLDEFVAGREREGAKLAAALCERLDGIERIVAEVRAILPDIRGALRAKLEARLAEFRQPAGPQGYEPGRLEQELVLQLSRIDVDEELDRLAAHVGEARRVLALTEPVGRRLDFLMQEFNREANTLASKSADSRTTRAAVELKVLIEQMREQVQNLE
ncbi:MAG: YicC family protein [Proteobacteria bacterium]|nr:YicC family protein [Pseudomonadota bacterium]